MSSSLRCVSHARLLGFCLPALVISLALAGPAVANVTPPGTNGKIAFSSDRDNLEMDCSTVNTDVLDDSCGFEIYTMNPDGSGLARLTNNSFKDDKPSWSPDGTQIAFESRRNCTAAALDSDTNANGNCFSNIFVMDSAGGNVRQLTFDSDSATHPTWSPDGTKIAFERGDPNSDNGAPDRIYVVPAAGGAETLIDTLGDPTADGTSPDDDTLPAWSPDGSEIAFTRISGNLEFVFAFAPARAGTTFRRFLQGDATASEAAAALEGVQVTQPAFENTSTFWAHTFVQASDGSGFANPIGEVDGCTLGKLFISQCQFDTNPAWAPDGARLAIQHRLLGCALDSLPIGFPIPIGNQLCFNPAGHAVNDVDIVTMPRDGSGQAILNANEPADCGPDDELSRTPRPQCFSDHKPAYAPENNSIAFHSDRVAVTNAAQQMVDLVAETDRSCQREFIFTTECPFNIHTTNLLGTIVSGPLSPAANPQATNINADWQPIFLAPTSFAFVSGCSTDGIVPVQTAAHSPGKGAVAAVRFRIDGGAEQSATVSNGNATIQVPNGRHTLTYFAVNQAGVAEAAHTATVVVDTVNHCGSAIGILGVRTLATCASRNFVARFAVSSAIGVRRVRVFLDGKQVRSTALSRFSVPINVKKLKRGRHVLRTAVTDVNGQTASRTRIFRACPAQVRPRRQPAGPRFTG
ncbi:MAG: hypothetical protein QOI78_6781 [Actinomycetota bacterium]|nr:hypothetical protein [Actinomycetota bacterium]